MSEPRSDTAVCYRTLDLHGLRRLLADGQAQLVEVLGTDEYRWARLPGAIHVPLEDIATRLPAGIDPARPLVTYCNDYL